MSNYENFAVYYDELLCTVDYAARARYFDAVINKFTGKRGILLDVACGTGTLSFLMADQGYDVIGADLSLEMLEQATEKNIGREQPLLFLNQAMQDLDLYGTVDAAICALDSVNHITDPNVLIQGLSRIALFLDPDGIFVFDVNTVYKHDVILRDHTFVYDLEDVYCVWQNELDAQTHTVNIHLDFFELQENGSYERYEEEFSERAYTPTELEDMLTAAGLETVAVYDCDSFDPPCETSERVIYVIKKRSV